VPEYKESYEARRRAHHRSDIIDRSVTRKETVCDRTEDSAIVNYRSTMRVGPSSQGIPADLGLTRQEQVRLPEEIAPMAQPFVSRVKKKNVVEESDKTLTTQFIFISCVKIVFFAFPV
jgi:hypothetical protein